MSEQTPQFIRFLSWVDVIDRTSLSRATIHRLMREGQFPQARQITELRSAFVEAEVEQWMRQRLDRPAAAIVTNVQRKRAAEVAA